MRTISAFYLRLNWRTATIMKFFFFSFFSVLFLIFYWLLSVVIVIIIILTLLSPSFFIIKISPISYSFFIYIYKKEITTITPLELMKKNEYIIIFFLKKIVSVVVHFKQASLKPCSFHVCFFRAETYPDALNTLLHSFTKLCIWKKIYNSLFFCFFCFIN